MYSVGVLFVALAWMACSASFSADDTYSLPEMAQHLEGQNQALQKQIEILKTEVEADHDLLFKVRHHVALAPYEINPYTESAWHYAMQPAK